MCHRRVGVVVPARAASRVNRQLAGRLTSAAKRGGLLPGTASARVPPGGDGRHGTHIDLSFRRLYCRSPRTPEQLLRPHQGQGPARLAGASSPKRLRRTLGVSRREETARRGAPQWACSAVVLRGEYSRGGREG